LREHLKMVSPDVVPLGGEGGELSDGLGKIYAVAHAQGARAPFENHYPNDFSLDFHSGELRGRMTEKPAKARSRQSKKPERLNSTDWVSKALEVLETSGIDSVRVEPIAEMLKVTKGSFYWHFKDRSELCVAMLETWRKSATSAIIARIRSSGRSPEEQLHELFMLPRRSERSIKGAKLELAIRNWSVRDEAARAVIAEVDAHRMQFITVAYEEMEFPPIQARAKAFIFYASLLGQSLICIEDSQSLLAEIEKSMTSFR
jgi:AcrR family transcriptional regulator